jgi:hypothetical protein
MLVERYRRKRTVKESRCVLVALFCFRCILSLYSSRRLRSDGRWSVPPFPLIFFIVAHLITGQCLEKIEKFGENAGFIMEALFVV